MRTAVVTGAGRGIGLQIAHKLSAQGYAVLLTTRDEQAGRRAAAQVGPSAWSTRLDVRDPDQHRGRRDGRRPRAARNLGQQRRRYVASKRHTIQVDFDDYMRELRRERRAGWRRAQNRQILTTPTSEAQVEPATA